MYGPANALSFTMVSASVSLSALNDCSSTIGPAGLDSTCFNVTSFFTLEWNTTVVSSLASTELMLASRDAGPFSSLILVTRSKENFTSDAVRSWPFANFNPFFSFTVNSVPSALHEPSSAAMSGDSFDVL